MANSDITFEFEKPCKRLRSLVPEVYNEVTLDIVKIFNYSSALICQLNNCTSRKLHPYSFSWNMALEYSYANPYQHRRIGPYPNLAAEEFRPKLGSIEIRHPPTGRHGPSFACLYAQFKMGSSDSKYYLNSPKVDANYKYIALYKDTYQDRLEYFHQCLNKLLLILYSNTCYNTVVFPKNIGSGMARGNWEDYKTMLYNFSHQLKLHRPEVQIFIVSKPSSV